jgi:hypothetical protein
MGFGFLQSTVTVNDRADLQRHRRLEKHEIVVELWVNGAQV